VSAIDFPNSPTVDDLFRVGDVTWRWNGTQWVGAYGFPWTPASVPGLELWLDAADADTITHSGGAVSAWTSKDENERTFTKGGTTVTTGSLTLNSLNVLDFNAAYFLSDDAASIWKWMHDGTEHWMFAVIKPLNTSSPSNETYAGYWGTGSGTGNDGAATFWGRGTVNFMQHVVYRGVAGTTAVNNQPIPLSAPNAWNLYSCWARPSNATAASRSAMSSGGSASSRLNTQTNAVSTADPTYTLAVAAIGNNAFPFVGQIAEILMYSGALAGHSVQRIESYLAARWNQTVTNINPFNWR
jgi:hypothetical protein